MQGSFNLISFTDNIEYWKDLKSVNSTFSDMGFDEIEERNGCLLIKPFKNNNIFLKIIEQEKLKDLPKELTTAVKYLLLIENYKKFRFIKRDSTINGTDTILRFNFSKNNMGISEKNKLNSCIMPNNRRKFESLFDEDELTKIISLLEKTLTETVNSLQSNELKKLGDSLELNVGGNTNYTQSAKRALLTVASAAMFHKRLDQHLRDMKPIKDAYSNKKFVGKWPPQTLRECYASDNSVKALLDSWRLILAVDYKPIFEASRKVLKSCDGARFNKIIKDIIDWSETSLEHVSGLKHDILGRLFHIMLEDARYDGSFYTSVPASIILAGLAIRDSNDIPKNLKDMRVIDPACGTGTLLMAVAERIKEIGKTSKINYDPVVIIENVLTGIDINETALHMTATTLGLLSPSTQFKNMNIRKAPFGKFNDGVAVGSLELYGKGGTFPLYSSDDVKATKQIETGEKQPSKSFSYSSDLVVMNPPFTRNDLRHDQLGEDIEKKVKNREESIFNSARVKVNRTSSGPMFLMLAEHLVKEGGVLAVIIPLVATIVESGQSVREFFATKFHVDTIIVSDDPKRFYFSENTNIAESLVILRKTQSEKPTKIIHLGVNPNNASDAIALVNDIIKGTRPEKSQILKIPNKVIRKGDWSGVQFFSKYLSDSFSDIKNSKLFSTVKLGNIATISTTGGRKTRGVFDISDTVYNTGWVSIWKHQTKKIISIENKPHEYIKPKKGKKRRAEGAMSETSTLLLPEKLQPNLTHVSAICSTVPTTGSAWIPVIKKPQGMKSVYNEIDKKGPPSRSESEIEWYKAMSIYLNSTVGIISLLGIRVPRKPMYPRFATGGLESIPVPILDTDNVKSLLRVYEKHATKTIGIWSNPEDPVRKSIDAEVCKILNLKIDMVDRMRLELAHEPMCTGKQYVSPDGIL